ncbi:MAG: hypothetical protein IJ588_06345 [Prevotella sp.]|nr:hypothetical protein [Prevotella sp.]
MEEEVFNKQEADGLTTMIASRLGERQQKLERMESWEHESGKTRVRPIYIVSAVAACVAVILLMMPFGKATSPWDDLGLAVPSMTEYRAATPDLSAIMEMIDSKDYAAALERTKQALELSDKSVKETEDLMVGWADEEMLYELEQEMVMNGEIRWTYIYLLVTLDKKREAKKELKKYLKNPAYCEHEEDAKALLNAL